MTVVVVGAIAWGAVAAVYWAVIRWSSRPPRRRRQPLPPPTPADLEATVRGAEELLRRQL